MKYFLVALSCLFVIPVQAEDFCVGGNQIKFIDGIGLTVGQAELDINGDGKKESLSLKIDSGCFVLPYLPDSLRSDLVGEFYLELWIGQEVKRESVNKLLGAGDTSIVFRNRGLDPIIKDYNGDNQPDFTLCTFGISTYAGNDCTILTIDRQGGIRAISDPMFVDTGDTSTDAILQVDKETIKESTWHAGSGDYVYYKWNGKKFEKKKTEKQ